jgi:hypothetical protein
LGQLTARVRAQHGGLDRAAAAAGHRRGVVHIVTRDGRAAVNEVLVRAVEQIR